MKDITVKELVDKKVEIESYLFEEITNLLLKFQKETGCDIKNIHIMMKEVYNGMFYYSDRMTSLRYCIEDVGIDIDLQDF
jgi:hypothetical protein